MLFAPSMKIAVCLWLAFVIYMIAAALKVKRAEARESSASRWTYMAIILLGIVLIFTPYLGIGKLGLRFMPFSPAAAWIGLLLVALGLAFAVWSRRSLGRNWSSSVTIKEGHELVRTGPYAFFRHPMYVGIGTALLGTTIVQGHWKSITGVLLYYAGLWKKARTENAFLLQKFGDQAAKR